MLSDREKQILHLISMELTTVQIARDLYLSPETVRSHRKSIMFKLHALNTAGMIRRAYEMGILKISAGVNFSR
ncbi:MAG: helix-turn-helix transcriptional regulator [Saprospiraceae bacterium]|nr:helix-turn-helix transcriptional regulator [Saprospiraceae bacterium]